MNLIYALTRIAKRANNGYKGKATDITITKIMNKNIPKAKKNLINF